VFFELEHDAVVCTDSLEYAISIEETVVIDGDFCF
jgi:hypothetical protein